MLTGQRACSSPPRHQPSPNGHSGKPRIWVALGCRLSEYDSVHEQRFRSSTGRSLMMTFGRALLGAFFALPLAATLLGAQQRPKGHGRDIHAVVETNRSSYFVGDTVMVRGTYPIQAVPQIVGPSVEPD